MKCKVVGMCRGEGKGYIKLHLDGSLSRDRLVVKCLVCSGTEAPANLYFLEHGKDSRIGLECVVVVALLAVSSQHISIYLNDEDGLIIDRCSFNLSMRSLKWISRLSYLFRKKMVKEIRDIDKKLSYKQINSEFLGCVVGGLETIIYIKFKIPFSCKNDIRFYGFDQSGCELNIPFVRLSETNIGYEGSMGLDEREIIASIRLPNTLEGFVLGAEDFSGVLQGDFQCMEHDVYQKMREKYYMYTLSACKDPNYAEWSKLHKSRPAELLAQEKVSFEYEPLISVIVPVFNTPKRYLSELLNSIYKQSYQKWELVLVNSSPENLELSKRLDDISDERIKIVKMKTTSNIVCGTNAGIKASCGEFVSFLDHDDMLEENALFEYVKVMNTYEDCDLIYCDEDSFNDEGIFMNAHFKPDFNKDLLLTHNYITHFLMLRKSIVAKVGMSPEYVNGAQDYDLTLRSIEVARRVYHIPKVLYHWRIHAGSTSAHAESKPYAHEAGKRSLIDYFSRQTIDAEVCDTSIPFIYKLKYLSSGKAKVSIIIPNTDKSEYLEECVSSIIHKSSYSNYEIVIIENHSVDKRTFVCYEKLVKLSNRVSIIKYGGECNRSKIMNFAAKNTNGEYLLFLSNDTSAITSDFIEELVGYASRDDVGVVGAKLLCKNHTVWHAGLLMGTHDSSSHLHYGIPEHDEGYFGRASRPQDLSAVSGDCQMVSRNVFNEVGGYSIEYTLAYGDVDFCLKVREAGYLVVFNPYAILLHYESSTMGRSKSQSNMLRFEREKALIHYRWPEYFIFGDPYYNINLDKNNLYFALNWHK